MLGWRTPRCFARPMAARPGKSSRACDATDQGPAGSQAPGGMCLHTILLDPSDPARIFIAISAAGTFRTDDSGKTWRPINRGLRSEHILDPDAEVGHCVQRIAMHRSRPNVLFMQKHWDVMRSDDVGESWQEIQREPADRLRVRDRCSCARAGHHLCRPDQERLGALPARRKVARLPQPHGQKRVGAAHEPFVRFFACEEDLSHEPPDAALPAAVALGEEPFLIIAAIAGG